VVVRLAGSEALEETVVGLVALSQSQEERRIESIVRRYRLPGATRIGCSGNGLLL
jgi:hypothetical protein